MHAQVPPSDDSEQSETAEGDDRFTRAMDDVFTRRRSALARLAEGPGAVEVAKKPKARARGRR